MLYCRGLADIGNPSCDICARFVTQNCTRTFMKVLGVPFAPPFWENSNLSCEIHCLCINSADANVMLWPSDAVWIMEESRLRKINNTNGRYLSKRSSPRKNSRLEQIERAHKKSCNTVHVSATRPCGDTHFFGLSPMSSFTSHSTVTAVGITVSLRASLTPG